MWTCAADTNKRQIRRKSNGEADRRAEERLGPGGKKGKKGATVAQEGEKKGGEMREIKEGAGKCSDTEGDFSKNVDEGMNQGET